MVFETRIFEGRRLRVIRVRALDRTNLAAVGLEGELCESNMRVHLGKHGPCRPLKVDTILVDHLAPGWEPREPELCAQVQLPVHEKV